MSGRLTVSGKPAYLREVLKQMAERYGDVPLAYVLATMPEDTCTYRQPEAAPPSVPEPPRTLN